MIDRLEIRSDSGFSHLHTSLKPYSREFSSAEIKEDLFQDRDLTYLFIELDEWNEAEYMNSGNKPFLKKFYKKKSDFFYVNTDHFQLKLNPVLNTQLGKESAFDGMEFINTRGLEIRGKIDDKIGFYSLVTENQMKLPLFVRQRIINQKGAMPGAGWVKTFKNEEQVVLNADTLQSVDFFIANGYITFDVTRHIDLQFGHDKNFIGNGFRSVLLSDYSSNYFFLKLNTNIWKINYQNLFMELNHFPERTMNALIQKKYGVIHYLSLDITKNLNIGLFESVIFARGDSNQTFGFEMQYLNPVIFYRSLEHSLGSPDNTAIGLNIKYNFLKKFQLYGQFFLDDFDSRELKFDLDALMVKSGLRSSRRYDSTGSWLNKWAYQLGFKYIDIAGIENLDLQLELNGARPYTYAHRDTRQSFSHFAQPLAHPYGSNFREFISIMRYQLWNKLFLENKFFFSLYGTDREGENWGGDILKDYFNPERYYFNTVGQGIENKAFSHHLILSYQLKHNLFADFNYLRRRVNNELNIAWNNTTYIGVGLRYNIPYITFDY